MEIIYLAAAVVTILVGVVALWGPVSRWYRKDQPEWSWVYVLPEDDEMVADRLAARARHNRRLWRHRALKFGQALCVVAAVVGTVYVVYRFTRR